MRLSRLTLRRFRSHAMLDAEFDGRPVAITGPNGAGKTNVLEAISMLSPGRGLRGATAEEMARQPDAIGWSVAAQLVDPRAEDAAPRKIVVSVSLADGVRRSVAIDGEREAQTALGRLVSVLWLTPTMDRLWTEGAAERRRFLDRATLALDPEHALRAAAYEKAMRERNRLLKDAGRPPTAGPRAAWLDRLEAHMALEGYAMAAARAATVAALAAAQEAAATAFPIADLALAGPYEAAAPPTPDAVAERLARGRSADAAAGRTLFGPHRSDLEATFRAKGAPARLCSTGEQKALLVSLVLATARASAARADRAPILLLDEIAAHFDPERRAALAEEILALGAQAVLTGAEAALFDAFGDRAQRLAF